MNYYNEFDPAAAAWLRQLIADGLIPAGDVDTRSITKVKASELREYHQCHFFAGIGGWPLAVRLAGADGVRLWTGSCPCQPFSAAGKQKGQSDERHLWPVFFDLIRECKPDLVFGEQVASAIRFGWLDGVCADLEGAGYACGAAVLGAHSVGAAHIRQRLYWVADRQGHGRNAWGEDSRGSRAGVGAEGERGRPTQCEHDGGVADQQCAGLEGRVRGRAGEGREGIDGHVGCGGAVGRVAYAANDGHVAAEGHRDSVGPDRLIYCRDNKYRRIPAQSGVQRLADGVPYVLGAGGTQGVDCFPLCEKGAWPKSRNGLLRGYGNAIVPSVASVFIEESLAAVSESKEGGA